MQILKRNAFMIVYVFLHFIAMNSLAIAYTKNYQLADTVTTTIGSVPLNSGFYYSDPGGGSMSITQSQNIPVIVYQYPNGRWINMNNGSVPTYAIVYQYINGRPIFFCRVFGGNQIYYGQLVPNEGCYLFNGYQGPITEYQAFSR